MRGLLLLGLAAALCIGASDINEELLAAARAGDVVAVKGLLDKGAALEAKTPYGQTPLYLAAMNGHEAVVRYLLEKGAETDVQDTFYKAPMLGFVLQRKHYGVAKLLILKGTRDPDASLASVVSAGQADLLQTLLDKSKPSQPALDKAYEAALEGKKASIAALLKTAGAREPQPPIVVDPKVLESYAGTYKAEGFPLDIKVFAKDGKLHLQATGQSEFAPRARSAARFEFPPAGIEIEFETAASFTLKQGGRTIQFKKVTPQ